MHKRELLYKLGDVVEVMDLDYPCEITYIVTDGEHDYEITALTDKTKVHFITENCINRKIGNNGWINVNDRKPNNNTKVIAYSQHLSKYHFKSIQITLFNERYFDDTGHWLNWGNIGNPQYKVTHWQPLPKPPKG